MEEAEPGAGAAAGAHTHSPSPSTAWLNLRGPWGRASSRVSRRWASPGFRAAAAGAAGVAVTASPASSCPYSSCSSRPRRSTAAAAAPTSEAGATREKLHSRAMALRLSPPAMETRRAEGAAARAASAADAPSRTALPRPSWMFTPEWPPSRPATRTSSPAYPAGTASASISRVRAESPPPAGNAGRKGHIVSMRGGSQARVAATALCHSLGFCPGSCAAHTCASNVDLSPLLGVQVDHRAPREHASVQLERPCSQPPSTRGPVSAAPLLDQQR